jgi:hypothetical protein
MNSACSSTSGWARPSTAASSTTLLVRRMAKRAGTNFRLQTVRLTLSFRAALACPATAPPMFALAETKRREKGTRP